MIKPSLDEFRQRATRGNLIPIVDEILADLETPVSVLRKLSAESHAFLLESVEQGERLGRYSFLGANPLLTFESKGGRQRITPPNAAPKGFAFQPKPVESLRALLARYKPVHDPDLPPFTGGAVGYMAYDTVRDFERLPDTKTDDLGLPDYLFLLIDSVVAFDHVKRRMILIVNAFVDGDVDAAYHLAVEKLKALRAKVAGPAVGSAMPLSRDTRAQDVRSNMSPAQFENMVLKAKDYIAAGDIFQVVLSQRLTTRITCDPLDIYRALRAINPSPYMFYLNFGVFKMAGSSPEILVRLKDGEVTVRPIAGTRPRGATWDEDQALEKELLADEKEIAEHVMLVDLGRNDIGRVCEFGTVTVNALKQIERYSHVMHIVSNVVGRIVPGKDAFDVLAACFPAGTVSGAPKIRAMEIIDELETTRRGPYAGAVLYIGFNGSMDSCITIRTATIHGDTVHVQAGAGIVADSDPRSEFDETTNKARGMMRAVAWAQSGLE